MAIAKDRQWVPVVPGTYRAGEIPRVYFQDASPTETHFNALAIKLPYIVSYDDGTKSSGWKLDQQGTVTLTGQYNYTMDHKRIEPMKVIGYTDIEENNDIGLGEYHRPWVIPQCNYNIKILPTPEFLIDGNDLVPDLNIDDYPDIPVAMTFKGLNLQSFIESAPWFKPTMDFNIDEISVDQLIHVENGMFKFNYYGMYSTDGWNGCEVITNPNEIYNPWTDHSPYLKYKVVYPTVFTIRDNEGKSVSISSKHFYRDRPYIVSGTVGYDIDGRVKQYSDTVIAEDANHKFYQLALSKEKYVTVSPDTFTVKESEDLHYWMEDSPYRRSKTNFVLTRDSKVVNSINNLNFQPQPFNTVPMVKNIPTYSLIDTYPQNTLSFIVDHKPLGGYVSNRERGTINGETVWRVLSQHQSKEDATTHLPLLPSIEELNRHETTGYYPFFTDNNTYLVNYLNLPSNYIDPRTKRCFKPTEVPLYIALGLSLPATPEFDMDGINPYGFGAWKFKKGQYDLDYYGNKISFYRDDIIYRDTVVPAHLLADKPYPQPENETVHGKLDYQNWYNLQTQIENNLTSFYPIIPAMIDNVECLIQGTRVVSGKYLLYYKGAYYPTNKTLDIITYNDNVTCLSLTPEKAYEVASTTDPINLTSEGYRRLARYWLRYRPRHDNYVNVVLSSKMFRLRFNTDSREIMVNDLFIDTVDKITWKSKTPPIKVDVEGYQYALLKGKFTVYTSRYYATFNCSPSKPFIKVDLPIDLDQLRQHPDVSVLENVEISDGGSSLVTVHGLTYHALIENSLYPYFITHEQHPTLGSDQYPDMGNYRHVVSSITVKSKNEETRLYQYRIPLPERKTNTPIGLYRYTPEGLILDATISGDIVTVDSPDFEADYVIVSYKDSIPLYPTISNRFKLPRE